MGKKAKHRVRRGRPQSAPSRGRPHKGPPPRPARKPEPPGFGQKLRRSGPLFWGLAGLAIVAIVAGGWMLARGARARRAQPATTPAATATLPPAKATPPASASLGWSAPPAMAIDVAKSYTATIVTEKGDIVLELFAAKAPITVNSFVFLARQGFYDGVTFHRVLPEFMAQAGDPAGTGSGGPGYRFQDEIDPELTFDKAGLLAMANSGRDTNGSQFFITYAPAPWLNGKHTIFGRVAAGMDVLKAITPRDPTVVPAPPPGDRIQTIRIGEG